MSPKRAIAIARVGERRIQARRNADKVREDRLVRALHDYDVILDETAKLRLRCSAQERLLADYRRMLGLRLDPPPGYRDPLLCERVGRGDA